MEQIMQAVELCLTHAQVLNVFTRQFERKNVGISGGQIITVTSDMIQAQTYRDLTGQYLVPGLIDAHVHIESAMVTPSELSKALLLDGVTSIVADPHEIANVTGLQGMTYMLADAAQAQLGIYYMAPSTVPCTPMSHNGATLTAADLKPLYQHKQVIGLSEVMDYPAVAQQSPDMMQKLQDVLQQPGGHADGHGAGLTAEQLEVYRRAGITTDHECTTPAETLDRINAGMFVFLREGSVERDLENTIGVVTEANAARFAFCTDDKLINDVMREGSIDHCVRLAIKAGLNPGTAYTMASYNAAQAHHLDQLGAIAAGFQADLVVISDLAQVQVQAVLKAGRWLKPATTHPVAFTENTVHQHFQLADLKLPLASSICHVIGIKPNHIETAHLIRKVPVVAGAFTADTTQDILKIVVIERHRGLGCYGLGLVHGFNIKNGAVATTIAHDDHNLVAVGTDDIAINTAINHVTACGGGIAVAQADHVLSELPLPVAGLMSLAPYQQVAQALDDIAQAYQTICGGQQVTFNPFITLSFLTLPVIPTIKITDQGLYDFEQNRFISVVVH
ncbi:adenine deaminase [Loigolactobacillus bifermentans]|nr:adenine deaminase [Loigolactobacillus bifermentans]